MPRNLLASSATIEGITAQINKFYYSTSCYVLEGRVYNSRGIIPSVEVVKVGNRYHFRLRS